ncbi:hypothetical protein BDR07DRAFT_1381411 [Suillus spraguei]|nr:hypothetical protein BDR07DRAFT_1381411 [Suillus spraguei]
MLFKGFKYDDCFSFLAAIFHPLMSSPCDTPAVFTEFDNRILDPEGNTISKTPFFPPPKNGWPQLGPFCTELYRAHRGKHPRIPTYLSRTYGEFNYLTELHFTTIRPSDTNYPCCYPPSANTHQYMTCISTSATDSVDAICEQYRTEWAHIENAPEQMRLAREEEVQQARAEEQAQWQAEIDQAVRGAEEGSGKEIGGSGKKIGGSERQLEEAERQLEEMERQREGMGAEEWVREIQAEMDRMRAQYERHSVLELTFWSSINRAVPIGNTKKSLRFQFSQPNDRGDAASLSYRKATHAKSNTSQMFETFKWSHALAEVTTLGLK